MLKAIKNFFWPKKQEPEVSDNKINVTTRKTLDQLQKYDENLVLRPANIEHRLKARKDK
jgi:hypothetical protein